MQLATSYDWNKNNKNNISNNLIDILILTMKNDYKILLNEKDELDNKIWLLNENLNESKNHFTDKSKKREISISEIKTEDTNSIPIDNIFIENNE